jgi:hypothetical protein
MCIVIWGRYCDLTVFSRVFLGDLMGDLVTENLKMRHCFCNSMTLACEFILRLILCAYFRTVGHGLLISPKGFFRKLEIRVQLIINIQDFLVPQPIPVGNIRPFTPVLVPLMNISEILRKAVNIVLPSIGRPIIPRIRSRVFGLPLANILGPLTSFLLNR